MPATHEVFVIAATASVIAAVVCVNGGRKLTPFRRHGVSFQTTRTVWLAFGIARFSGQSGVPSWYRNTLAALFCTLLLLVAAAVVVAVYIEDRQY